MITKCNPNVVPEMFGGLILDGIPCVYSADGERGSNQLIKCQTQNIPPRRHVLCQEGAQVSGCGAVTSPLLELLKQKARKHRVPALEPFSKDARSG